jgi:DNA transposition AAA+ family ATPase
MSQVLTHPSSPPQTKSGPSVHEPQLPKDRIDEIRQRLRKHLDDNRGTVSQSKVAAATEKPDGRGHYSDAAITHFLGDTYPSGVGTIALAVERYLNTYDRQQAAAGGLGFVRTSIARRVEDAILQAEATQKIALIINDAGVGITEALLHYRDTHDGTVLIECDPSMNSKWALTTELLAVASAGACRMRPADAMREVVRQLAGRNRTILVDEAHHLTKPDCIEMLRRAADRSRVALVLAGNESTYQGRNGGGSALATSTAYMQFERRVIRRLRIRAGEIKRSDVRLVLAQMLPESVLGDDILGKFVTEAHHNGGIGRCIAVAQTARMLARSQEPLQKHVLRAFKVVSEDEDGGDA